jgi:hypothetical protein
VRKSAATFAGLGFLSVERDRQLRDQARLLILGEWVQDLPHHFARRVASVREVVAMGREHTHAARDDGCKVGQIVARNMVASVNGPNVSRAYFDFSAAYTPNWLQFCAAWPEQKNPRPIRPAEVLILWKQWLLLEVMIHDLMLHRILGECSPTECPVGTIECHKGVGTCCIRPVLMILTTIAGHDSAAEGQNEGGGKSDLRLGEHCRISCSADWLNLLIVQ